MRSWRSDIGQPIFATKHTQDITLSSLFSRLIVSIKLAYTDENDTCFRYTLSIWFGNRIENRVFCLVLTHDSPRYLEWNLAKEKFEGFFPL